MSTVIGSASGISSIRGVPADRRIRPDCLGSLRMFDNLFKGRRRPARDSLVLPILTKALLKPDNMEFYDCMFITQKFNRFN